MADSKEAPPQKDLFVEAVWMLFAFLIAVSLSILLALAHPFKYLTEFINSSNIPNCKLQSIAPISAINSSNE